MADSSAGIGAELYDNAAPAEPTTPAKPPNLLEMDGPKAAKALVKQWTSLDPMMRHRLASWEVNQLRREGYTNVRLIRRQDSASFTVFPPAERRGQPMTHAFNKARTLCRTFVGNLLADPPAAIVEPTSDADDDRDAQEISQRALDDWQHPLRLNTPGAIRDALDRACTYGSGFVRYYVDPAKGGRVPKTLMASPLATDAENPLIDPTTGQPFGAVVMGVDPMGQPTMTPGLPPSPVERFVTDKGQLSDDQAEAALEWKPGLCRDVLDGRHVRFLPWGTDRRTAEWVLVATYVTLREARSMAAAYNLTLSDDDVKGLTAYKPESSDYLLPDDRKHQRDAGNEDALVFCLTGVARECPDYPDGAYLTVLGDKLLVFKDTWVAHVKGRRVALPLPVAQVKQWTNGKGDPYGDGMMDDLGGANEVRAAQIGHLMHYLDTWNNMPVFVPSTSTMTDADFLSKRFVRTMPGQLPTALRGPGYEAASMELFGLTGTEMDSASHLQQAAQGVEDPSVTSGRHAFQIISQVHAQLSEPKQHTEEGYLTASAIELALIRGFNLSGETRWQGEDGAYKYEHWEGADLSGDVRLKPGTMTMMAPGTKAQLLKDYAAAGWLAPEAAQDLASHNLDATLGKLDDPYLLEINRSIARWEEGMPEGYQPPQPVQTGMQAVQTPQGPALQPVMQAPPDPVALGLFPPKPHHALPLVARKRLEQLARLMASVKFDRQPQPWQALIVAEYERMLALANPPQPVQPGAQPSQPGASAQTPNPAQPPSASNPTLDPQRAA